MNNLVCNDRQYRRPGLVRLLFEFVFPHYCKVCGRRLDPTEEELCISCFLGMPRLDYDMNAINPTERMLLTERSLVRAASILHYSKESDYRNILFHLKYWHHPKVGRWLAAIGAAELKEKGQIQKSYYKQNNVTLTLAPDTELTKGAVSFWKNDYEPVFLVENL